MEEDFSDQSCFLGLLSYTEILSFYCSFLCSVLDAFSYSWTWFSVSVIENVCMPLHIPKSWTCGGTLWSNIVPQWFPLLHSIYISHVVKFESQRWISWQDFYAFSPPCTCHNRPSNMATAKSFPIHLPSCHLMLYCLILDNVLYSSSWHQPHWGYTHSRQPTNYFCN